jgi:hypothetical protein
MASAPRAPIYVSLDVWDEVEDMTEALRKMQEEGSHTEERDEEEDSYEVVEGTKYLFFWPVRRSAMALNRSLFL